MAIIVIAVVAAFVVTAVCGMSAQQTEELPHNAPAPKDPTHDSLGPVYTYNGEGTMRVYVFTDTDSGVQYLVSDKGGVTPRLGKNGHIIGVVDEVTQDDEV